MVDDKASWPAPGKLHLDGLIYNTFARASPCNARERLEWLQRQPALPFKPQPYQQLAEVLRRSGREADAKKVLIARERARRKHGGLTRKGRVWSVILDVMIGHGYKPYKIIPWGAVFVLLGWALFYHGHEAGRMVPVDEGAYASAEYRQTGKPPAGYPAFNAFVYSLDTFLPIVDLHQETYWEPSSGSYCTGWSQNDHYDPWLRFYLWFQILAGWFVTTLGVAGFTGLVRKD